MKNLILTSSIGKVASDVFKRGGFLPGTSLCFIITASEAKQGDLDWRIRDRSGLVAAGFIVTDYTISGKSPETIKEDLSRFDVVCMEGGDTFYLLRKIQETGCAGVLRDLVDSGKAYIGSSAGSIVAGPDIYPLRRDDPISEDSRLGSYRGLGLTDIVILPHWGSMPREELYLTKRLGYSYGLDHKIMILTDYQYLLMRDDGMQFIEAPAAA